MQKYSFIVCMDKLWSDKMKYRVQRELKSDINIKNLNKMFEFEKHCENNYHKFASQ